MLCALSEALWGRRGIFGILAKDIKSTGMMTEKEIDELKSLVEKIAAVLAQQQRVMSGTSSPSTRLKTLSVSR
jgi:hypothetical protein